MPLVCCPKCGDKIDPNVQTCPYCLEKTGFKPARPRTESSEDKTTGRSSRGTFGEAFYVIGSFLIDILFSWWWWGGNDS